MVHPPIFVLSIIIFTNYAVVAAVNPESPLISFPNLDDEDADECYLETIDKEPYSPLVPCQFLDARFVTCENPADVETVGNSSRVRLLNSEDFSGN